MLIHTLERNRNSLFGHRKMLQSPPSTHKYFEIDQNGKRRISPHHLAETELGWSKSLMFKWIRGAHGPSWDTLEKGANALDMEFGDFCRQLRNWINANGDKSDA